MEDPSQDDKKPWRQHQIPVNGGNRRSLELAFTHISRHYHWLLPLLEWSRLRLFRKHNFFSFWRASISSRCLHFNEPSLEVKFLHSFAPSFVVLSWEFFLTLPHFEIRLCACILSLAWFPSSEGTSLWGSIITKNNYWQLKRRVLSNGKQCARPSTILENLQIAMRESCSLVAPA